MILKYLFSCLVKHFISFLYFRKLFNLFLFVLLVLSSYSNTNAQVKIKEKIEIQPKLNIPETKTLNKSGAVNTVEITMTWSNSGSKSLTLRSEWWCNEVLNESSGAGGILTITHPVTLGNQYCVSFGSTLKNLKITVKMDGILISEYYSYSVLRGNTSFRAVFPPCGEGAEPCTESETPKLEVEAMTPAEYSQRYGFDWCKYNQPSGRFQPLFEGSHYSQTIPFLQDFEISPCYDASTKTWYPRVASGSIKFNAVKGVCWDVIEGADKILITSFDDLHNINIVNVTNCGKVQKDFLLQYTYSNYLLKDLKYFIIPVIELHENIHMEHFENFMNNEVMNEKINLNKNIPKMSFKDLFKYYEFECQGNYQDINYVKKKYKEHFNEVLKKFAIFLRKKYEKYKRTNDYENITHKDPRIQALIKKYLDELSIPCKN